MKKFLWEFRRIGERLRADTAFRAFHEGRSAALPDYYRGVYETRLGAYATLLSAAERTPDLSQASPSPALVPIAAIPSEPEGLRVQGSA
jgi:hypothetical protein